MTRFLGAVNFATARQEFAANSLRRRMNHRRQRRWAPTRSSRHGLDVQRRGRSSLFCDCSMHEVLEGVYSSIASSMGYESGPLPSSLLVPVEFAVFRCLYAHLVNVLVGEKLLYQGPLLFFFNSQASFGPAATPTRTRTWRSSSPLRVVCWPRASASSCSARPSARTVSSFRCLSHFRNLSDARQAAGLPREKSATGSETAVPPSCEFCVSWRTVQGPKWHHGPAKSLIRVTPIISKKTKKNCA